MFQKNLVNYKNMEEMYITMVILGCYWRTGLATGGGCHLLCWHFACVDPITCVNPLLLKNNLDLYFGRLGRVLPKAGPRWEGECARGGPPT